MRKGVRRRDESPPGGSQAREPVSQLIWCKCHARFPQAGNHGGAEAHATDAKTVADLARAAEVYARQQKLSQEAINYAVTVKIDAQTLMGEFLKKAPKNAGARGKPGPGRGKNGVPKLNPVLDSPSTPTLADLGITKAGILGSPGTRHPQGRERRNA